jgi:hypothetical protein
VAAVGGGRRASGRGSSGNGFYMNSSSMDRNDNVYVSSPDSQQITPVKALRTSGVDSQAATPVMKHTATVVASPPAHQQQQAPPKYSRLELHDSDILSNPGSPATSLPAANVPTAANISGSNNHLLLMSDASPRSQVSPRTTHVSVKRSTLVLDMSVEETEGDDTQPQQPQTLNSTAAENQY